MTDIRADAFDAAPPRESERERVEAEERGLAEERRHIARDGPELKGAKLAARLDASWRRPPGIIGWLATVDHKEIGRRYMITALGFFVLAGILALIMRLQLAKPDNGMIGAERYNQLFSMHGSTMMFLFAVPVMEGVAVYMIPLMLGTRSTAFPRLNAFSYFMYLFGGLMLWIAFVLNMAPDVGWFEYTPLSGPQYSPGKHTDIWAQMVTYTEVAALAAAVVLVCTILKARAPGMTLARMPLFAWAMLVEAVMIIFAMPAVADRKSTRLNSSHPSISYAVFCLKKKNNYKELLVTLPPLVELVHSPLFHHPRAAYSFRLLQRR